VEFTGPDPQALARLFTTMGFHRISPIIAPKNVRRYAQGDINFILKHGRGRPGGGISRRRHGPSANAMAFRVHDAARAFEEAV